jgi:hypothetical protein
MAGEIKKTGNSGSIKVDTTRTDHSVRPGARPASNSPPALKRASSMSEMPEHMQRRPGSELNRAASMAGRVNLTKVDSESGDSPSKPVVPQSRMQSNGGKGTLAKGLTTMSRVGTRMADGQSVANRTLASGVTAGSGSLMSKLTKEGVKSVMELGASMGVWAGGKEQGPKAAIAFMENLSGPLEFYRQKFGSLDGLLKQYKASMLTTTV